MMILVTGGSKCGKSRYSENLFENFSGKKYYIATMKPYGEEAFLAIERHQKMRMDKGFETIEKYVDIHEIGIPNGCGVLLECTANLCANEMFNDSEIKNPSEKIISAFKYLKERTDLLVVVTNDVGLDGISYEKSTAEYVRVMGEINSRLAKMSDNVVECVYGIPILLKGNLL